MLLGFESQATHRRGADRGLPCIEILHRDLVSGATPGKKNVADLILLRVW